MLNENTIDNGGNEYNCERFSPLDIETMLHIYYSPSKIRRESEDVLTKLELDGLIKEDETRDNGYRATERGNELVHMWCCTPLPEYHDPRF